MSHGNRKIIYPIDIDTNYPIFHFSVSKVLSDIKICNACEDDDAKVIYTRRYQVNNSSSPELPQSPHRRKLYRTSIEKWRPAKGSIYCPKCGVRKPPLIRTRAERYSTNECGAACILGCWPFCFLPCLFPGDNKEYLHCANCKNFLGLYDREFNCVKPNREFVENTSGAATTKSEISSKRESELPEPVDCDDEDDKKCS